MYARIWAPSAWTAASLLAAFSVMDSAAAQLSPKAEPLPKVIVEQSEEPAPAKPTKKKTASKTKQPRAPPAAVPLSATAAPTSGADAIPNGVPADRAASLVSPNISEARAEIDRTPGGVELVPDTAYKASTPSATVKDALDYVPGVFAQSKWGDDTRLSIRGSGLSRNFHVRGLELYMDGIPINTADGFGDFQEIDPTAYRYIEVYKGANALRFRANSLGGAINFVMPTGYDSSLFGARVDLGSFGFHKLAGSSGGVSGPVDYFITGTAQELDGFRDHSWGESARGALEVGYRLSEDAETRVYVNANWVRQRIPGEVTKQSALITPQAADPLHVTNDWQRNIDTLRIADKTALRLGPGTLLEVGAFNVDRHLMHPIFLWLDNTYDDYGGFARLSDAHLVGGHNNRLIVGANLHNGDIDARMYGIGPAAAKLALLSDLNQNARNFSFYAEDAFDLVPGFAIVAGTNYLHAVREQSVVYSLIGDKAGGQTFDLWSPKLGLLWDVDPGWQVFANVNKSAEIPSFGENQIGNPILTAEAQTAITYEIGTRGRRADYSWDLAVYRTNVDYELQCLNASLGSFCQVVNANETIHQGVEAGFGAAMWRSIFVCGKKPDTLWLNAAYTFSDFRFNDDPSFGSNQIPGAPRHYLCSELLYKHPSGVYLGPNIEWVPQAYWVDNANTLRTAAYAIWGLKVGFDNGDQWTAYIEGRNLFGLAYIASSSIVGNAAGVDLPLFNPGNGREVYGGVQYRWGSAQFHVKSTATDRINHMKNQILSALCALLIPAVAATGAAAHIVLETPQAKFGAAYQAVFKVPHGCEGSPTVEVRVDIPEGVIAVKPMPKPGWSIALAKASYARSYAFYHGEKLSEGVHQLTWSGGPLPDEYFDEFVLSTYIAGEAEPGRVIYFPVTQRCEKGEQHWAEIPANGQSAHALKFPAPQLTLVADGAAEAKPVNTVTADGKLLIEGAWARPTPEGTTISAGYLKITNRGDQPDVLLGASTPAAASAELHESAMTADGVMTMRPLENGLEIKPWQTVELKPAGAHIMILGVKNPLKEGQMIPLNLNFKSAGTVEVPTAIKTLGSAAGHEH